MHKRLTAGLTALLGSRSRATALKIALIYLLIGAAWILFSDYVILLFTRDISEVTRLQTLKGWAFVFVTALVLYKLIRGDLSAFERLERSKREFEVNYKMLADSITDIFFALDGNLRYTYVNKAMEQMTGASAENAIGKHLYDVFPRIRSEKNEMSVRKAMETGEPQVYAFTQGSPRGDRTFSVNIYPARNGGLSVFIRDITGQRRSEERVRESLRRTRTILDGTVNVLSSVAEKRDPYIAGHQHRSARLAAAIAREMGLPEDRVEGIRVAGLLHDIGKIYVPAEILSRPARLTESEYNIIKLYPRIGYDIVRSIPFQWPVARTVLQHQERMDGSGYPAGMTGERIILEARVLGVADIIDAATSHRPYRSALDLDEVLDGIAAGRGTKFDADAVDAAIRLLRGKKFLEREAALG